MKYMLSFAAGIGMLALCGCAVNGTVYMPLTGINYRSNDVKASHDKSTSNTVEGAVDMEGGGKLNAAVPAAASPVGQ